MTPIAIVGLGGVFPGSPTLKDFWELIASGKDASRDIPDERWGLDPSSFIEPWPPNPDKSYASRACFVDTYSPDWTGLNLDPAWIDGLDPSTRMLIHAGKEAFFSSRTQHLDPGRVGVILGQLALPTKASLALAFDVIGGVIREQGPEWSLDFPHPSYVPEAHGITGFPAQILARALALGGCAYTLDAACASSLFAVKLAADALSTGRADMMLIGGMCGADVLYLQTGFSQLRAVSRKGRCAPFDKEGDGLVVGEGAGVAALKRLDDALAHGDRIHSVIRGFGLSNDKEESLLAPAREGQLRAMKAAYEMAGWEPWSVDLIECHATGTPVGDRVEFGSLKALWEDAPGRKEKCVLSGVKSSIGHLLTGAGIAALIKTVLALEHETLPPTANFRTPHPDLGMETSPFEVLTLRRPWHKGEGPRRAGVSGFGFGGTNAHILLEEWREQGSDRHGAASSVPVRDRDRDREAVAVVGMAAAAGPWPDIRALTERWFRGDNISPSERSTWFGVRDLPLGYYMDRVLVPIGKFRIPPREMEGMLPQQGLMLQVAEEALNEAGHRAGDGRMASALIGVDADPGASNYYLRMALNDLLMRRLSGSGPAPDDPDVTSFAESAKDAVSRPMGPGEVLGGLASIAASRIAREFNMAGPCYTLSSQEASGIHALLNALRSLSSREIDLALVGAVDFYGDARTLTGLLRKELDEQDPPADGAAALVLKRLSDAQRDGNRIYGVIRGSASAASASSALERAAGDAGWGLDQIGFVETDYHGQDTLAGDPRLTELRAVLGRCADRTGRPGAASGLFSVIRAALALDLKYLPASPSGADKMASHRFLWQRDPGYWEKNSAHGPRKAAVTATGQDGGSAAVLLTEYPPEPEKTADQVEAGLNRAIRALGPPESTEEVSGPTVVLATGKSGITFPEFPGKEIEMPGPVTDEAAAPAGPDHHEPPSQAVTESHMTERTEAPTDPARGPIELNSPERLQMAAMEAAAGAHEAFLDLTRETNRALAELAERQQGLFRELNARGAEFVAGDRPLPTTPAPPSQAIVSTGEPVPAPAQPTAAPEPAAPALSAPELSIRERMKGELKRSGPAETALWEWPEMMKLAKGKISEVFGPAFQGQDHYDVQVRLPEPPLLLCERVLAIDAEPKSMGLGTIWTEHTVTPDKWYLHFGRMPAGIFIESGQADLTLISYLGIDFYNRGDRMYRLLGCEITWFGEMPRIGDTLKYEIRAIRHARQGDVRIFFFEYECWVGGQIRSQVRNGHAGFFNRGELSASQGAIWEPTADKFTDNPSMIPGPCVTRKRSFNREETAAYANGEIWKCFGDAFSRARTHHRSPGTEGGRLNFIHEITDFDPKGGAVGRGYLRAVQPVTNEGCFLDGHFKNDPCMPGTLMANGCQQMLAFFLTALGHTLKRDGWRFEPKQNHAVNYLCRGEVNPSSRELIYEIFVDDITDEEGIITLYAHILCTVDGLKALLAERAAVCLVPDWPAEDRLESAWETEDDRPLAHVGDFPLDYKSLMNCALGRPSKAFGPQFARYDGPVPSPRLPNPPYHFMTRITRLEGVMGSPTVGSNLELLYDVPGDVWYFRENSDPVMPFCVLMEVALQPCGWLATFNLEKDVHPVPHLLFRNLDGDGTVHRAITPKDKTIRTTVALTAHSKMGHMIIVKFDVHCYAGTDEIFTLDTAFGFFPPSAFIDQKGLDYTEEERSVLTAPNDFTLDLRPFPGPYFGEGGGRLPASKLLMIDRITGYWPEGGKGGKGQWRAEKAVDPSDWYFKAHFFTDPVQPGSLGVEAIVQLIQFHMLHKGMGEGLTRPAFHPCLPDRKTEWHYRGQVVPENESVVFDIEILEEGENRFGRYVEAEGRLWVNGKKIYHVPKMGMRLVEAAG